MPSFVLLAALLGGIVIPVVAVVVLRVWGYRVEVKVKPLKSRRRRPIEPDEHTAFL